jgi:radical SAM superfamily enzyme YgiQ (UPF0313 family)
LFIARACKEKNIPVVIGGAYMTTLGHLYISRYTCLDYFIEGPGEQALLDFIRYLEGEIPIDHVPNLHYRIHDTFSFTYNKTVPMAESPVPDYTDLVLERYSIRSPDYKKLLILPYITSRGCINKCTFCNDHIYYTFDHKPVGTVIREITHIIETYKIDIIMFNDLTLFFSYDFLNDLCDRIIAAGLLFRWGGMASVVDADGKPFDAHLIEKMRKSGCTFLHFAPETASDELRKIMGKKFSTQQFTDVLKLCTAAGIRTVANFIHGFPYETLSQAEQTVQFVKENHRYIDNAKMVKFYVSETSAFHLYPERLGIQLTGGSYHDFKYYFTFIETGRSLAERRLLERQKKRLEKCIYQYITRKRAKICMFLPYSVYKTLLRFKHRHTIFNSFISKISDIIKSSALNKYLHPYMYKYNCE